MAMFLFFPSAFSASKGPWGGRPHSLIPAQGFLKAQSQGDVVPAFLILRRIWLKQAWALKGPPWVQRERIFSALKSCGAKKWSGVCVVVGEQPSPRLTLNPPLDISGVFISRGVESPGWRKGWQLLHGGKGGEWSWRRPRLRANVIRLEFPLYLVAPLITEPQFSHLEKMI